jgi:hypothetical protein
LSPSDFPDFLKIVSGQDRAALDGLLAWLNPWLRAVIRARLAGHRLRGVIGVSDVLQSLIKDFVQRAKRDADVHRETIHMERYLAAAVEKKIRAKFRKERRHPVATSQRAELTASEPSIEKIVEANDLVAAIRRRLDNGNQHLLDLRMQGLTWPELSGLVGGNPDAVRMRLRRSVAAAICELDRKELVDRG